MNIRQYKFDRDIVLFNLGDVHRGNIAHDNKLFQKVINYIYEHDNCYWFSTGDLLDVSIPTNKFFDPRGLPLDSEYKALIADLYPIKNKGLFIVGSNHHKRFERVTGMAIDTFIAKELDLDYLGFFGVVDIVCDRGSYITASHHGVGRGQTRGSKVNNLERLSKIFPSADIYVEGHTHTYDTWKDIIPYIDRKRNKVSKFVSTFAVTGHCLNWEESYAPELKLKEAPKGFLMMSLKATGAGTINTKKVDVDLFY
jgi:hypothetical protein